MLQRTDHTYMMLDGMPFIRDHRGQNWVYPPEVQGWIEYGTDDWDARTPTHDNWFAREFGGLPDIP